MIHSLGLACARIGRSLLAASGRHARPAIIVAMLLVAVTAGMGLERFVVADSAIGSQRHEDLEDLEAYQTLEETYNLIREAYVQSDEISDEELIWGASEGMMQALGDEGHSDFLNPEDAAEYYEQQAGEFVGIGINIDTEVAPPRVIMPMQDSPAQQAGIRQEDVILAVDGVPYTDFEDQREFVNLIGGEEGTDVTLEIRHLGEPESVEITITRASIQIKSVSWAMLPNNVLWLRIDAFIEGTGSEVERALRRGKRLGAEGVILDLRGNGGGLITEEHRVIGEFVETGSTIAIREDADGNRETAVVEEESGLWREGPLVVLINGDSASASEVTTAAIVENDRGIAVGETTFGTGTSLAQVDLSDGSLVLIGVEMWLTPDGNVIWHKGFEPNIHVVNEPGALMALPYLYDDNVVTEEQLSTNEDDQLLTAYDEVLDLLEGDE